ncbi:hypothetical protein HDU67_007627, partial [Dinochytrium kinnereticum]
MAAALDVLHLYFRRLATQAVSSTSDMDLLVSCIKAVKAFTLARAHANVQLLYVEQFQELRRGISSARSSVSSLTAHQTTSLPTLTTVNGVKSSPVLSRVSSRMVTDASGGEGSLEGEKASVASHSSVSGKRSSTGLAIRERLSKFEAAGASSDDERAGVKTVQRRSTASVEGTVATTGPSASESPRSIRSWKSTLTPSTTTTSVPSSPQPSRNLAPAAVSTGIRERLARFESLGALSAAVSAAVASATASPSGSFVNLNSGGEGSRSSVSGAATVTGGGSRSLGATAGVAVNSTSVGTVAAMPTKTASPSGSFVNLNS